MPLILVHEGCISAGSIGQNSIYGSSVLTDVTEYGPRAGHTDCWSVHLVSFSLRLNVQMTAMTTAESGC